MRQPNFWIGTFAVSASLFFFKNAYAGSATAMVPSFFKRHAEQSSDLKNTDMCAVTPGTKLSYPGEGERDEDGVHYKVTLDRALPGCSFQTGYFFDPHFFRASPTGQTVQSEMRVTAGTLLKQAPVSSAELDESESCAIPGGTSLKLLNTPFHGDAGHVRVRLAQPVPGCGFEEGFVYGLHTETKDRVQRVPWYLVANAETLLKARPVAGASLANHEKCRIDLVTTVNIKATPSKADGNHLEVSLLTQIPGCSLERGFVFLPHAEVGPRNPFEPLPPVAPPPGAPPPGAPPPPGGPVRPKPSFADFVHPMINPTPTSGWCICRNIGTSPHIGQDWSSTPGRETSVAMVDGVVESVTYDSACGWSVVFKDDAMNANWRYVHLDKPSYSNGKRLRRGEIVGQHNAYPKSSCGTGAHLHFEKRTSGLFDDTERIRTCQRGARSCYFDPVTPFRGKYVIKDEADRRRIVSQNAASENGDVQPFSSFAPVAFENSFATEHTCRPDQPVASPIDLATVLEEKGAGSSHLIALVSSTERANGRRGVALQLALSDGGKINTQNVCHPSEGDCISKWELFVQEGSGVWSRVVGHAAARGVPARLEEEGLWCLPRGAGQEYLIRAQTHEGKRLFHRGTFAP